MGLIINKVVFLALCAGACIAGVAVDNIVDHVDAHLDFQELHLRAVEPTDAVQDNRLITEQLKFAAVNRNIVADSIANLLESFRDVVINGNENLPPLDPLVVNHIGPFSHSSLGVRVTANIHDFNAEGLEWYVVDSVTFNALRLAVGAHLTIPRLTFTGSYDAAARITLVSHNAGGNIRVFVNRIEVGVDIRLGTSILGGNLFLRELDIDIAIHDINIRIEGMFGSSILNGMINNIVQDSAQNLIHNELDAISKNLSKLLFETINEVLRNFTLDDLLSSH